MTHERRSSSYLQDKAIGILTMCALPYQSGDRLRAFIDLVGRYSLKAVRLKAGELGERGYLIYSGDLSQACLTVKGEAALAARDTLRRGTATSVVPSRGSLRSDGAGG